MNSYRVKIYYSILLTAFAFFGTAFGQDVPRILLNEGEINDTTITGINGSHFGFKIDWGQGHNDTLRYEVVHGREKVAMDRSLGKQIGIPVEFNMHNIRRVRPGNKLAFNIELNGKKISRLFYVLSTKASETKPWFFNVYFVLNSDTLNTDNYEIFFLYPKDSLNSVPSRLERDKYTKFTRYFFSNEGELPKSILIKYKKYKPIYDFIASNFFHADIRLWYLERKKRPRKERWEYNAGVEFSDLDAVGWGLSQSSYK